jgi:hypothetical protein
VVVVAAQALMEAFQDLDSKVVVEVVIIGENIHLLKM